MNRRAELDTALNLSQSQNIHPPVRATSYISNGHFPRRRWLIVGICVFAGFVLSAIWSAEFVDQVIGDNIANTLLGHDAKNTQIPGMLAGTVFALVTGFAGTFTACNIAVLGAVSPCLGTGSENAKLKALRSLRPLVPLSIGMLAVSASYGAIVSLFGTNMPQYSTAAASPGMLPDRLLQSVFVFGVIGVIMIYLGLASLGLVPDPFARLSKRLPNAPLLFMGVLIGGFLIGRPFPLFRKLFRDAAESGNPLYGAAAFSLQSVGNIIVMVALFLILGRFMAGPLQAWLSVHPSRLTVVSASSMVILGVFTVLYWDVRLLATFDVIPWYPVAPWV